jgi:hypothetical protein
MWRRDGLERGTRMACAVSIHTWLAGSTRKGQGVYPFCDMMGTNLVKRVHHE